jgi:hypothetical protein
LNSQGVEILETEYNYQLKDHVLRNAIIVRSYSNITMAKAKNNFRKGNIGYV